MTDQASIVSPSLVARVKGILLNPGSEWNVIKAESATVQSVFVPYALILAAIGPIAVILGNFAFGVDGTFTATVVSQVVGYVLALGGTFVFGLIINALASSFGARPDPVQAMKVAVYSATPGWLAGIFGLFPPIQILALVAALYGLYLLFIGLPRLMEPPQDKAVVYTIVAIVAYIVVLILTGVIVGMIVGAMAGAAMVAAAGMS